MESKNRKIGRFCIAIDKNAVRKLMKKKYCAVFDEGVLSKSTMRKQLAFVLEVLMLITANIDDKFPWNSISKGIIHDRGKNQELKEQ